MIKEEYIGPLQDDGGIPATCWDDPQYWIYTTEENNTTVNQGAHDDH